jgi:hypothetical protein
MRYSVSQTPNRLLIVIPHRFSLFVCLLIDLWAVVWVILVVENPAEKPESVLGVVAFGVVTILFAYRWRWNIGGREVMEITPQALTHRPTLFAISRPELSSWTELRTLGS